MQKVDERSQSHFWDGCAHPFKNKTLRSTIRLKGANRLSWIVLLSLAVFAGCATRGQHPDPLLAGQHSGQALFENHCTACHQLDGQGMGAAPPLEGSSWVVGPPSRLIKIVLHGVRGPIEVGGTTYNREMPGFGDVLSDGAAAALVTFVRSRFGNVGTPVETESVRMVREASRERRGYWTAEELLADP